MSDKKVLVRVNTRIGHNQNDWLDEYSAETGISKSSLIQLAVENYINQKQSVNTLEGLLVKLDAMEQELNKLQE